MKDFSVLIGGKAGFGIDKASLVIADILNRLGYRIYIYRDYPSLIRGGHTFSIIRASPEKTGSHKDTVDIILALNQDTIEKHKNAMTEKCLIVYDSDTVKADGYGVGISTIIKELNAPEIMKNVVMIGAMCKVIGIGWDILESVICKNFPKDKDINIEVAKKGYEASKELTKTEDLKREALPIVTGNEALSLGMVKAGLDSYISYPMTPTSPILHFLASIAEEFSLKVIHPENEIAVILMALGISYCGERVAVGTSGGGFCLMTEGLSFSGMAELPVTIVLGQRPGPSTGLPTYSCQTELHFALNAGQGEFARFVVAPGDAEEAYYWAQVSLNLSSKCQLPSIILMDKDIGESSYSFDIDSAGDIKKESPVLWSGEGEYKRYANSSTGVSPLTFVPNKDAIIKVNSYEHDEFGITTEDPQTTKTMQDKRLKKEASLSEELKNYECVRVYGEKKSKTVILCWGSNKGACVEIAQKLKVKVVQPLVLSPFPVEQFASAIKDAENIIAVENNATSQLARLVNNYGFHVHRSILKYDGRPFSLEGLENEIDEVLR